MVMAVAIAQDINRDFGNGYSMDPVACATGRSLLIVIPGS